MHRLRQSVGGGDWQTISRGADDNRPVGPATVRVVPSLMLIQHTTFDQPTVLLVPSITGEGERVCASLVLAASRDAF